MIGEPYKQFDGQLVMDCRRGVIYFHDESGTTLLRVCRLDLEDATYMERPFIDVTPGFGASVVEQA